MTAAGQPVSNDVRTAVRRMRKVIYTCTFESYDNLLSPIARTPGARYLNFSDRRSPFTPGWRYVPLPAATRDKPQNHANRYCKLLPHRVLSDVDLSVYVDGNIMVIADLTPLMEEFVASGADIALFPGEDERTVADEICLVLKGDRLSPEAAEAARAQLAHYTSIGVSGLPITMNGVLFRRHRSAENDALMEDWWEETKRWSMRDQFTLPVVLAQSKVRIHHWSWQFHFTNNAFFRSVPHRRGARGRWGPLSDVLAGSVAKAPYSRNHRILQERLVEPVRRLLGRPPIRKELLQPAASAQPKGD